MPVGLFNSFRTLMQRLLTKPVTKLANRFSSSPKQEAVLASLSALQQSLITNTTAALQITDTSRIILFSDHHKGKRNGADDFASNEPTYLAALNYYQQQQYSYVNLGDSEELWENNIFSVLKHNKQTFAAEKPFIEREAFVKVYGNHDVFWHYDPLAAQYLKQMYGKAIPIVPGLLLQYQQAGTPFFQILCTHGHQGDASSDGNWLSAAFVTYVWGPLQAFLRINTNTPAASKMLKSLHNNMMY